MASSHEHHNKDAKKEEKKDDKKEGKKVLHKEVHKHEEPAHAHEAHAPKHEEPAQTHEAHAPKHTEPEHVHKHAESAHAHDHGEPAHAHVHEEAAHEHKHGEPAHAHVHEEAVHEHKHGEPAHEHKPVAPIKKVTVSEKLQAGKAPEKASAATSKAADIADEIELELSQGQAKVEGGEGATEPEVEIVEDEAETKKEEKGEEAKDEPNELAKEEAKEEKKKGKKGGKLKGKKKKKEYHAQPKAEISAEVRRAMDLRRVLKDKTPNFIRQDAYNYSRLGESWRKPRGKHSKLRHHISYRINVVSIGYGSPNLAKGLHPSGFREVLVHHPLELDGIDPKTQAARVAHGVGSRKREMIQRRAERMGIRILNEIDTS